VEGGVDSVAVVALEFDGLVSDCAAARERGFELGGQGIEIGACVESFNDSHLSAVLALIDTEGDRLASSRHLLTDAELLWQSALCASLSHRLWYSLARQKRSCRTDGERQ
jgi:hypothetical protein